MLLKPIRLIDLLGEPGSEIISDGLRLLPTRSWVVDGEDRLSYTTLTRLVECCREYHWREDIENLIGKGDLDSITKSISANYFHPILIGKKIIIRYKIEQVRKKGYTVKFIVINEELSLICAEYSAVFLFFNNYLNMVIEAPIVVFETLTNLTTIGAS